jgi:hypothetical protein
MQLKFFRCYNTRMNHTISSCLINIGYQIKNNIQTSLENILAMFDVFREYGIFEKKINFWMIKCL